MHAGWVGSTYLARWPSEWPLVLRARAQYTFHAGTPSSDTQKPRCLGGRDCGAILEGVAWSCADNQVCPRMQRRIEYHARRGEASKAVPPNRWISIYAGFLCVPKMQLGVPFALCLGLSVEADRTIS